MTNQATIGVKSVAAAMGVLGLGAGAVAGFTLPAPSFQPWQDQVSKQLLAFEGKAGESVVEQLRRSTNSTWYVENLVRHETVRTFGAVELDRLREEPGGPAFLEALLGDPEWMELLLCSGPVTNPGEVLRQLYSIWRQDPGCASDPQLRTLSTAIALEFGRREWPADKAWTRYCFYRDSQQAGLLHPLYDDLDAWEKRWLAGYDINRHGEPHSQVWLRDNVKLPAEKYRGACWQVPYRGFNYFGDSVQGWKYYFPFEGSFPSFSQMCRYVGGVCGRLSGYGAGAAVANGIPATTMGEPGHCAYTVRTARGAWKPAYSLSWKRGVHVNLYGESFGLLVLTDRMFSDEAAFRAASLHRWQARLHRDRDPDRAMAAYQLAAAAQSTNYPVWDEIGGWLAGRKDTDLKTWLSYHQSVLAGLGDVPEIAWMLVSRHVYPAVLDPLDTPRKIAFMGRFHQAIDDWGPNRWDVEGAISHQVKQLGDDEAAVFKFLGGMIACHGDSPAYSGPVLSWGMQRYNGDEKKTARYVQLIAKALNRSGGEIDKDGILKMCSDAILVAERNRDMDTFQALGPLIRSMNGPLPKLEPAFPGTLLSAGGMLRLSSVSSRWDEPYKHWLVLGPSPGFFHTDEEESPWVEVDLRHFGELSGIEIVNRAGHGNRAVPLEVAVSVDGKEWSVVETVLKQDRQWMIDLRGKKKRARHVRLTKQGKGILHLENIRVYGRRLS